MAQATTIKELRKMQLPDLLKEIAAVQLTVAKLRLGIKLGKEKNSAKYIREKRQLARMKTVASEKTVAPLEATSQKTSPTT